MNWLRRRGWRKLIARKRVEISELNEKIESKIIYRFGRRVVCLIGFWYYVFEVRPKKLKKFELIERFALAVSAVDYCKRYTHRGLGSLPAVQITGEASA